MSVMIVENDWFLTAQLETWLREEGVEVAGVAASVAAARAIAARSRPAHAIVDYNLGGEMARSLIAELCDAGVKVVVVSGYANICEEGGNVVAVFQKPAVKDRIMRALRGA
jgi:ActR/RegA family two-component response regulator